MSDRFSQAARYLAVIPAAGAGRRVGTRLPKQYLALAGRTMLEWSVDALLATRWIERVVVVVAPDDQRAAVLFEGRARVEVLARGGLTRRDTVLAGIESLARRAHSSDWVLVHDAARPALETASLARLRDALAGSPVGGLLALPVTDTVKRTLDDHRSVAQTLDREQLWIAQTPQMFRLGALRDALAVYADVTDEASAIERAGHAPVLVEGARTNFKVTSAEDLELMRLVLAERQANANRK